VDGKDVTDVQFQGKSNDTIVITYKDDSQEVIKLITDREVPAKPGGGEEALSYCRRRLRRRIAPALVCRYSSRHQKRTPGRSGCRVGWARTIVCRCACRTAAPSRPSSEYATCSEIPRWAAIARALSWMETAGRIGV
jgi:hypothetical protein